MRKLFLILAFLAFTVVMSKSWASITRLQSLSFNTDAGSFDQEYRTGNFKLSNTTLENGDIVQTNSFVYDGGADVHKPSGDAFWAEFKALQNENAADFEKITNSAIGKTGVYFGPLIVSQVDLTTNTVLVNNAQ